MGANDIALVITGGLRVSSDFAKALAMGADAVAVASAALIAAACQQYRICGTGKCPVGIATQDPDLRARLKIEASAQQGGQLFELFVGRAENGMPGSPAIKICMICM